ncbi:MAG: acetyl-CoA carboxylase biotin carboxylase subunit [Hyphomicrobiales bacterium]|nr:acetyl-CoA carboxylase biotin carboxylase subunit [Hyphomicrobiales bacterium]
MKLTPFKKILVANRGEIALRVMRTARRMGYGVVAVYSAADKDAAHVRAADEAVPIGESLPAQSYLRIDAIVAAAKLSGADAVHPGYGFLAENEDFAAACKAAGLVFIGPSPDSIRAMGDKAGAKAIMSKAGVPCVPGFQGVQDDAVLKAEADRIGYPVMIKATAGGGGRGMRLVPDAASFADMLRSAKSEAQNAFGDPTVILERAIVEPRHIEIQVFGDRYGNAIHLGERDCSVQRRHQKLIEEAPSPAVDAALREKMGAVAVAAVRAIGYEGAGTLEFLLDQSGDFYFMEMNTRLQVEHPVTEAITGLDLVELQLRVAAGQPLPLTQADVKFSGHAIEARLCAEDAGRDFMPQSGRMLRWEMAPHVRAEHALQSGADIPPFYDSMIAKLVAHGVTRDEARQKLASALDNTIAFGVTTNQAFLAACLRDPVFAAGGATTAFIDARGDALRARPEGGVDPAILSALLLYATGRGAHGWRPGRALRPSFALPLRIDIDGETREIEAIRHADGGYELTENGNPVSATIDRLSRDEIAFHVGGLNATATYLNDGDRLFVLYRGRTIVASDLTLARPESADAGGGDGKVRAQLSGRVVALLVKPGDRVERGQPVATLEAMKMQHVHAAGVAGAVTAVHAAEGDQTVPGAILVEIEPAA